MDTTAKLEAEMLQEDKAAVRNAISYKNIYPKAWAIFKDRWRDYGKLLLAMMGLMFATTVAFAIVLVILVIIGAVIGVAKLVTTALMVVLSVAGALGVVWLVLFTAYAGARIFYEERSPGKFWWQMLKSSAPSSHRYAWIVLLQALSFYGGMLGLYVGGLYVGTRTLFAQFMFIDRRASGLEAVMASNDLVRGKTWRVFLVVFLPITIVWALYFTASAYLKLHTHGVASALTRLVSLFTTGFVAALVMCTYVATYRELKHLPVHVSPKPKRVRAVFILLSILGAITVIAYCSFLAIRLKTANRSLTVPAIEPSATPATTN